jgi:hypothetical protein
MPLAAQWRFYNNLQSGFIKFILGLPVSDFADLYGTTIFSKGMSQPDKIIMGKLQVGLGDMTQ